MKNLFKIIFLICTPIFVYSHSLVLNIIDNEDETMTVIGGFNTGESAQGALLKLEALNSKKILFEKRLPDESELTIKIPNIPYQIILEGGPGHTVSRTGIEPPSGFIKKEAKTEQKKKERPNRNAINISSSKAVTISIVLAFILLLGTIIVSIINTNKLMRELKRN
ncbi:hypothetical protein [Halarcobacter anaerophilus]|uniref:hypothetical protein n=1 Tax=Halarcobacter anaerophilus TaxID=877500 RepID=UPI0005C80AFE|nr:hypothetical protein [Halarcobacter anaerophilus]